MRYRRSLRFRILMAFVLSGIILGPALSIALLTISYELEERSIERVLEARLARVMAAPDAFRLRAPATTPDVKILGDIALDALPADIRSTPAGLYELEPNHRLEPSGELGSANPDQLPPEPSNSWYMAVGTKADQRYVVAADITALEAREQIALFVVGGGTILAVYLALWLGYHLSRRLLSPIGQLAEQVVQTDAHSETRPLATNYPEDEVGGLAQALDHYRTRMQEALARERAFSADASHELRNPLAVVQSTAEIIEADTAVTGGTRRAAKRMREATSEMDDTITALMLLLREPADSAAYDLVSIQEALQPLRERFAGEDSAAVTVYWHLEAAPSLRAPPIAIQSIAVNLLRNAVQNTCTGHVDVYLHADRVIVVDTGIGIPEHELADITARGVRGTGALSSGNGLGLSIVSRLCERFGWELTLTSTAGVGTRAEWRFGGIS